MVFSSIEFMFRFLPIFLIVYFAAAPKYRNIILLIGSLVFYGVGEPSYIILMILSILVNHFAAANIYRMEAGGRHTGILTDDTKGLAHCCHGL